MTIKVMTDDGCEAIVGKTAYESLIPAHWDQRKSVVEMRARHENRVTSDQNDDDDAVPGH
jgi:hypothetical protein